MASEDAAPSADTVAAVQRLLAPIAGGAIRVASTRLLVRRRSLVWRLVLAAEAEPRSVIVKQARRDAEHPYDPGSPDPAGPAWLLFNEWAALALLDGIPEVQGLAPRFHGGDRDLGLIVLEDLGDGVSLADLLLGGDPAAATAALEAYAAALGRIQAASAGRSDAFLRLRRELGPITTGGAFGFDRDGLSAAFSRFAALAAAFGVEAPGELQAEARAVAALLNAPGGFETLNLSDTCPDNNRYRDGRPALFDFEAAGYGHALLDGAYLRSPLPTCWCVARLAEGLPERLEALYRAELVRGCSAAADEAAFRRAMLAACAAWLVWSTNRLLSRVRTEDRALGPATGRRQVISRLRTFATIAAGPGRLEEMGAFAARLALALQRVWPEEATGLPLYPAFAVHEQTPST